LPQLTQLHHDYAGAVARPGIPGSPYNRHLASFSEPPWLAAKPPYWVNLI
jgi:hypothetical protein